MDILEAIEISNNCVTSEECKKCPLGKVVEFSIGESLKLEIGHRVFITTCGIVGLLKSAIEQLNEE